MTCPTCGYKGIEEGDHRCNRCGRRLDPPTPPALPISTGGAAPALAPEWKLEVAHKLEEFRQKRAEQDKPHDEETSERVPPPDRTKKVLAFEDFAAGQIEPVVIDPPPPPKQRATTVRGRPAKTPVVEARTSEPPSVARDVRCTEPVAPVALRALAGVLDAAVLTIAAGVFAGTFYLLGGGLPSQPKAAGGLALAAGLLAAFYLFFYVFYAGETPGMQWTGQRLIDFEGNSPRPGQRLVRSLGALLSAAALGLGYLWAVIDEESLTWHDRMSQTFLTRDERARRRFQPR